MFVLLLCVLQTPCNVLLVLHIPYNVLLIVIITLSGSGSTGRSDKIVTSIEN